MLFRRRLSVFIGEVLASAALAVWSRFRRTSSGSTIDATSLPRRRHAVVSCRMSVHYHTRKDTVRARGAGGAVPAGHGIIGCIKVRCTQQFDLLDAEATVNKRGTNVMPIFGREGGEVARRSKLIPNFAQDKTYPGTLCAHTVYHHVKAVERGRH